MTTTQRSTVGAPTASIDPLGWLRYWQSAWSVAPESLVQPILPGWTLNINSNNSSSPQTEADIVAKYSYGRQLGRISDVLELLISERPEDAVNNASVEEFLSMKRGIDDTKKAAAANRIRRITTDLRSLRTGDKPLYDELRKELLNALETD